jgi:hypothetical protein
MKEFIDKQLNWITDILDENEIDYFLNDGTLIGIMRDGGLIPWDRDIDIAILEKDVSKMGPVLKKAKLKGYSAGKSSYRGLTSGFHISPEGYFYNLFYPYILKSKIKGNRKIDISVLRYKNNRLWKPVLFSKGSDKKGILFYLYKLARGINTLIRLCVKTNSS